MVSILEFDSWSELARHMTDKQVSIIEKILIQSELGKKDRELLIELSIPGLTDEELLDLAGQKYRLNEPLANFLIGQDKEKARIALKIREYLEKNP